MGYDGSFLTYGFLWIGSRFVGEPTIVFVVLTVVVSLKSDYKTRKTPWWNHDFWSYLRID